MSVNRPFYFGTNVKMTHTPEDTRIFLQMLTEVGEKMPADVRLFYLPPYTSLHLRGCSSLPSSVWFGAQNMHEDEWGAYTGEISAAMLRELGVELVLLGHSERRERYNETDEGINRKVHAAAANGLKFILCIGETEREKSCGVARETLSRQLKIALHGLAACHLSKIHIAYEPVWAIGESGLSASPGHVAKVHAWIRNVLEELYPTESACVPILYGGSVNEQNCADLARTPLVDGLFVGRAVWGAEDFRKVLYLAQVSRMDKNER